MNVAEEWETEQYPVNSLDSPTNLEQAMAMAGSDLPQYVCRDIKTGALVVQAQAPTIPAPPVGERGVRPTVPDNDCYGKEGVDCAARVDWYGGLEDSPEPALPTGMADIDVSKYQGTLALDSVTFTHPPVVTTTPPTEPDWEVPVAQLAYSGDDSRPVFFRWWTYNGFMPTEVYLGSSTLSYIPSTGTEIEGVPMPAPTSGGLVPLGKVFVPPGHPGTEVDGFPMPRRSLGVYSFQLGVPNLSIEGGWEFSNIVHSYVGYDWVSREPVPVVVSFGDLSRYPNGAEPVPTQWLAGSGWDKFSAIPVASPVPTVTPHPTHGIIPLPVSPAILTVVGETDAVDSDGGVQLGRGSATVTLSPYQGELAYRYFTFNGFRATEVEAKWHTVSFASGDEMKFEITGLNPGQFYVFEVRAVTGDPHPGIMGNSSDAWVAYVKHPLLEPTPEACDFDPTDFPDEVRVTLPDCR